MANPIRVSLLFLFCFSASFPVFAQTPRGAGAAQAAVPRVAVGDLDGDGRADVVLADLDGDGMTDIVPLSRSGGRHDTVKNSINNVRREPADEIDLGDLDGDGRPELALLASSGRTRSLNDGTRPMLGIIRRELATGQVKGVSELISQGWLAPGAGNGDPLAHVVSGGPATGGGVGTPIPIPYPDPENNPSGGSSTGGTGGSTGGGIGSGFPASSGNEPGTATGVTTNGPRGGVFNPG